MTVKGNQRSSSGLVFNINVIVAFIVGTLVGGFLTSCRSNNLRGGQGIVESSIPSASIQHLEKIPIRNTSHKDDNGEYIKKQQFLEPFVVPRVTGFSVATLRPGQRVHRHEHENMHEFFYVLEGNGVFFVNDNKAQGHPGTFLHYPPHSPHEIFVPENSKEEMKMLVAGIVIDN